MDHISGSYQAHISFHHVDRRDTQRELSVTHAAEQFDVMSPDQQDVNLQRVIGEEVLHVLD